MAACTRSIETRPALPSPNSIARMAKRRWPRAARCSAARRAPATSSTPTTGTLSSVSPKERATKGRRRLRASATRRSASSRQKSTRPSTTALLMLQARASSEAAETSERPRPASSQASAMPVIIVREKGSVKKPCERLGRRDADGIDLAGAEQAPERVGAGVADLGRRGEHALADLRADHLRAVEHVRGRRLRDAGALGDVDEACASALTSDPVHRASALLRGSI